jgi:tRNA (guanine-N7-)-methyltransferase
MQRTIKSFVCRTGRVTVRQKQALDYWLKDYELPSEGSWDFQQIFQREADTIVEIGFGMGSSLFAMAEARPELNFIGIEVHRAGLGSLAALLHENGLTNVRLVALDAVQVFNQLIPAASLAGVQVFFPDPWHKKKHNKRRLIQDDFVKLLVDRLKPGGFIHCATDWEDYAHHMSEVLSKNPDITNTSKESAFIERPSHRPVTKFEQRGLRLGHGVWDLMFCKNDKV